MSDRAQQTHDARVTQIAACRDPERGFEGSSIPYLAKHADADKRTKAGERQVWCATCERWQWALCAIGVRDVRVEREARRAAR